MYNCSRNEHEEIPAAIALADASALANAPEREKKETPNAIVTVNAPVFADADAIANAPSGGNEILHAVAHAVAFALATATAPQGVTTET